MDNTILLRNYSVNKELYSSMFCYVNSKDFHIWLTFSNRYYITVFIAKYEYYELKL